jgi:hypothetical protein
VVALLPENPTDQVELFAERVGLDLSASLSKVTARSQSGMVCNDRTRFPTLVHALSL